MTASRSWVLERWHAGAGALHRRPIPVDGRRRVSVLAPTRPAVVLGSTTPGTEGTVTWGGTTVDVVRRRSGGGLVWLDPTVSCWVDLTVPVGDRLHSDDVGLAFGWIGELIAACLTEFGVEAEVHRGPAIAGPDDGLVCFTGRGAGEVFVEGRKLVGMSQRRTRHASRFQCVWYDSWTLGALPMFGGAELMGRATDAGIGARGAGVGGGATELLDAVVAGVLASG